LLTSILKLTAAALFCVASVGFLAIMLTFVRSTAPPAPELSPEEAAAGAARLICRAALETVLHDPDSAEWGIGSEHFYAGWPARLDGDRVTVQPRFRAANGLGATILTDWSCVVAITEGGATLLSLQEL
jgi:hypothetical protein